MRKSAEPEILTVHTYINIYNDLKIFLAFELSDVVFIMLINVKMEPVVGIITCMFEHEFHAQFSRA